jgi:hypothetical protein
VSHVFLSQRTIFFLKYICSLKFSLQYNIMLDISWSKLLIKVSTRPKSSTYSLSAMFLFLLLPPVETHPSMLYNKVLALSSYGAGIA